MVHLVGTTVQVGSDGSSHRRLISGALNEVRIEDGEFRFRGSGGELSKLQLRLVVEGGAFRSVVQGEKLKKFGPAGGKPEVPRVPCKSILGAKAEVGRD